MSPRRASLLLGATAALGLLLWMLLAQQHQAADRGSRPPASAEVPGPTALDTGLQLHRRLPEPESAAEKGAETKFVRIVARRTSLPVDGAIVALLGTGRDGVASRVRSDRDGRVSVAAFGSLDGAAEVAIYHPSHALRFLSTIDFRNAETIELDERATVTCQITAESAPTVDSHRFRLSRAYSAATHQRLRQLSDILQQDDPASVLDWPNAASPLVVNCALLEATEFEVAAHPRASAPTPTMRGIRVSRRIENPVTMQFLDFDLRFRLPEQYVHATVEVDFPFPVDAEINVYVDGPMVPGGMACPPRSIARASSRGHTGKRTVVDLSCAPVGTYSCTVTAIGHGTHEVGLVSITHDGPVHVSGPANYSRTTLVGSVPPGLKDVVVDVSSRRGIDCSGLVVGSGDFRLETWLPAGQEFRVSAIAARAATGIPHVVLTTSPGAETHWQLDGPWGPLQSVDFRLADASGLARPGPYWCCITNSANGASWIPRAKDQSTWSEVRLAAGDYTIVAMGSGWQGTAIPFRVPCAKGPIEVW